MNSNNFITSSISPSYNRPANRNSLRATYSGYNQQSKHYLDFVRQRQLQFQNRKNQFFNQSKLNPTIKRDNWQGFDNFFNRNDFNSSRRSDKNVSKKMDNKSFDSLYEPFQSRVSYTPYTTKFQNEFDYEPSSRLKSLQNQVYNPPYQNFWQNKKSISRNVQLPKQHPSTNLQQNLYKNTINDNKYDLGYCKTTPNKKLRMSDTIQGGNTSENSIDFKRRSLRTSKVENPEKYNNTNSFPKQNLKLNDQSLQKISTQKIPLNQQLKEKPKTEMRKSQIKATEGKVQKIQTNQTFIRRKSNESNKNLKISDFIIIKRMGKGRLGQVLSVVHKQTGGVFAIKKLLKQQILQNDLVKYLIQQIKYQSYAQNSNIIKLYAIFDDKTSVYLVMQLADDGSLQGLMNVHKYHTPKVKIFEQIALKQMFFEILTGLKTLHQLQLVHRDLKPGNIVLVCGVCKICDFGWVSSVSDHQRRDTYCGSMGYAAPEIFEDTGYDISVDMWEFGVIAYELLTGKLPFYNPDQKQTIKQLQNFTGELSFPTDTPLQFKDFISKFLKKNPKQRCSIKEMLNHPLLQKIDNN